MEYLVLYFIIGLVISSLVIIYFALPLKSLQEDPDYELLKETIWNQKAKYFISSVIFWPMIVYGFIEEWL